MQNKIKVIFLSIILIHDTIFPKILPQKVIICGVCRNVEESLTSTKKIIEKIGTLFSDYRVIIYENNSSDHTPDILTEWSKKNTKIYFVSEQLQDADLDKIIFNKKVHAFWGYHGFFKTELIARARNIVLNIATSPLYDDFQYLIWIDMDFRLEPSYEGFQEIFESNQEWDAVFAYGIVPPVNYYWDWYAFRDKKFPIGPELIGKTWWECEKKFSLNENAPWYPVYSAFGGCGIYKKKSLKDCQYSGLVTHDLAVLYKKIFIECATNIFIQKYITAQSNFSKIISIAPTTKNLSEIPFSNAGIVINDFREKIIWQMNSYAYQYPVVCEHVPLHASMIIHGHNKLYINPRLKFNYGTFGAKN